MSVRVAITSLATLTSLSPVAYLPVVQNGATYKVAAAALQTENTNLLLGRNLTQYGTVDITGTTDMTSTINTAISACAADRVPLVIGPGKYRFENSIQLQSNLILLASPAAEFRAYFNPSGGGAFVRSTSLTAAPDPDLRMKNIYVQGGVWGVAGTSTSAGFWESDYSGFFFHLFGDNITLEDVTLKGYGKNNTAVSFGNDITLKNFKATHPQLVVGAPGHSHWGGDNFVIDGYDFDCVADVIAIGPTMSLSSPLANADVTNTRILNGRAYSRNGRTIVIANAAAGRYTSGTMTSKVTNVLVSKFQHKSGGSPILTIAPVDSTELMENVQITDGTFTLLNDPVFVSTIQARAFNVESRYAGLKNLVFDNVVFDGGPEEGGFIRGNVDGLVMKRVVIKNQVEPAQVAFIMRGPKHVRISDMELDANGNTAFLVGSSDLLDEEGQPIDCSCQDVVISGLTVRKVANDYFALQVANCDRLILEKSTFEVETSTDVSARAVNLTAASNNVRLQNNDFRQMLHPTPLIDNGTGNTFSMNLGVPDGADGDTDTTLTINASVSSVIDWVPNVNYVRISGAGTITSVSGTPSTAVLLTLLATVDGVYIQSGTNVRLKPAVTASLDATDAIGIQWDPPSQVWREVFRSL